MVVASGHNNMWRCDKTLLNNRQAWICHRREHGRDAYLHTVDIVGHSHALSVAINVIYVILRLIGRPALIERIINTIKLIIAYQRVLIIN
jgi:hypothetical protein